MRTPIALISILLSACAGDNALISDEAGPPPALPPIQVTLVSHNELGNAFHQPECLAMYSNQAAYMANRAATLSLASHVSSQGARWALMTDIEYVEAVESRDPSPLDVLDRIGTTYASAVEVVAHAHELISTPPGSSDYNYADVAYKIQAHGLPDHRLVGGVFAYPEADQNWTRFRLPLHPLRAPAIAAGFVWHDTTLWGGGSPSHAGDEPAASGIWHPTDPLPGPVQEYFIDSGVEGDLAAIGTWMHAGDDEIDMFLSLIDEVEAEGPSSGPWTFSFTFNQCELATDPDLRDRIEHFIDVVNLWAGVGRAEWTLLHDLRDDWQAAGEPGFVHRTP